MKATVEAVSNARRAIHVPRSTHIPTDNDVQEDQLRQAKESALVYFERCRMLTCHQSLVCGEGLCGRLGEVDVAARSLCHSPPVLHVRFRVGCAHVCV